MRSAKPGNHLKRKCRSSENKLSNVRNSIIKRSGEGFTSFKEKTRTNFCGEKKKGTMKRSGVSIIRE